MSASEPAPLRLCLGQHRLPLHDVILWIPALSPVTEDFAKCTVFFLPHLQSLTTQPLTPASPSDLPTPCLPSILAASPWTWASSTAVPSLSHKCRRLTSQSSLLAPRHPHHSSSLLCQAISHFYIRHSAQILNPLTPRPSAEVI